MEWLHTHCREVERTILDQIKALQNANVQLLAKLEALQSVHDMLVKTTLEHKFSPNLGFDIFDEDKDRKVEEMTFLGPKISDEDRVAG